MPFNSFRASIEEPLPEAVADCGNCGWTGRADAVDDIEDCILTPGDPAPVGRCPECCTLVYVRK